jgi:hypothetical protein
MHGPADLPCLKLSSVCAWGELWEGLLFNNKPGSHPCGPFTVSTRAPLAPTSHTYLENHCLKLCRCWGRGSGKVGTWVCGLRRGARSVW